MPYLVSMTKAKGRNGWHAGTMEQLLSGAYRWRVRIAYPDGTKERRGGTARTKTEAQRAIIEAQQEAAVGQRAVTRSLTVEQMVREHMDAMRPAWSARYFDQNEYLLNQHIRPRLGNLIAAGVQPVALRAHYDHLQASGLGLSGQRQVKALLSGAYKRAIGDGLLRDNPTAHARPTVPREAAKTKAFTPEDAASFFVAALEDRWALPLAFMVLTGLRIGECVALTWEDVGKDRVGGPVVRISKSRTEFHGKVYEGTPKTAAGVRDVPLSSDAVSILKDMQARVQLEAGAHGLMMGPNTPIFPSPKTGRPMTQDTLRGVMERTCKRAGVPKLSPHKLRHTFGSMNLAAGLPVGDVASVMGHADKMVTLNFYQTSYDAGRRATALNLSAVKVESSAVETVKEETAPPRLAPGPGRRPRKGGPRQT